MDSHITSFIIAFVTFFAALKISIPNSPFASILSTILRHFKNNRSYLVYLLIMLSYLGFNALQVTITSQMSAYQNLDYTPIVRNYWGDITLYLQIFENLPLTYFLTYVYIFGYSILPWLFLLVMVYHQDDNHFRLLFRGITALYLLTLPFYWFFPVKEVWAVDPRVDYLIPQVYPTYDERFRLLSSLTNCFPSFHTSLSVLITLISWRSPYRNLRFITTTITVLIIISTLYLGIHWFGDIVAGALLAVIVATATTYYPHYKPKKRKIIISRLIELEQKER